MLKNKETSKLLNLADSTAESKLLVQNIRTVQNDAAEEIKSFDNIVLSDDKLVSFIENIENLSRARSLEISIASVDKVEDKKALEPHLVRIVMETQGSWSDNFAFLRAIESLPYRVMIESSNFAKEEDTWRLRITLILYVFN